jgi:hypothetical protein
MALLILLNYKCLVPPVLYLSCPLQRRLSVGWIIFHFRGVITRLVKHGVFECRIRHRFGKCTFFPVVGVRLLFWHHSPCVRRSMRQLSLWHWMPVSHPGLHVYLGYCATPSSYGHYPMICGWGSMSRITQLELFVPRWHDDVAYTM